MLGNISRISAIVGAALALALPAAATTAADDYALNGETLLWRLDPPDGGDPSYMVGTIHMVDERLEPAVDRALVRLEEAGALVVETDISAVGQMQVAAAMMLSDGRSLPDIIGDDAFARLERIGADYGMPAYFLRRLAPWGAALLISIPADQMQRMADGGAVFDQRLIGAAEGWSFPVETLEEPAEQVAAFADHPEADQITMLGRALDMHPSLVPLVDRMVERYVADDLAGLARLALIEMSAGETELDERVLDSLIVDRNRRMAERLLPLLAARPHLVAIGAMHLPGEVGVLNLLAAEGWTVTPAP